MLQEDRDAQVSCQSAKWAAQLKKRYTAKQCGDKKNPLSLQLICH
jgi:hypothetical protein